MGNSQQTMNKNSILPKLVLTVFSFLIFWGLLEGGYIVYGLSKSKLAPKRSVPQFVWCGDCPEIYHLNPEHPDVDANGFRSLPSEVPLNPDNPKSDPRILLLGDSVTYGYGVDIRETFSFLLESMLSKQLRGSVNVLNSGTDGYSTYNEYQIYLNKGRLFKPDYVVLGVVLNDVVNPRLHWGNGGLNRVEIPEEAIPNLAYDTEHAIPTFERWSTPNAWKKTAIYQVFSKFYANKSEIGSFGDPDDPYPTFITGEDDISISVLMDDSSPEFMWLADLIESLAVAVKNDGATLLVLVFPLSYQLDPGYPYLPQHNITEACARMGVPCIDLLFPFQESGYKSLFLKNQSGHMDVWHLSPQGHQLTAEIVGDFFKKGIHSPSGLPLQ